MPSIYGDLIPGVATYALEFFRGAPALDRIYVPIGLSSGICGVIAAKRGFGSWFGISTEIVGVFSSHAKTYQLTFTAGQAIPTNFAETMADGLAVRKLSPRALALMQSEVSDIVAVDDD